MKTSSEVSQDQWKNIVERSVAATQYGQVVITIHDGRVVQIERTEKTRLNAPREVATATH